MIVVTGAAGFIASAFIGFLNEKGVDNLVLVDDFSISKKDANLQSKKYLEKVERNVFCEWLSKHNSKIDFVFHLGARTEKHKIIPTILSRTRWFFELLISCLRCKWCSTKSIRIMCWNIYCRSNR